MKLQSARIGQIVLLTKSEETSTLLHILVQQHRTAIIIQTAKTFLSQLPICIKQSVKADHMLTQM